MQNSYTKEGQLSWWLASLWFHKPLPFKIKNYFNFYPGPPARQPGPPARPVNSPSPPSLRAPGP